MPGQCVLHQRAFPGAGHAAQNARPQRNAPAHGVSGRSGFGFDFDFFGAVVEQADADVIEAEVLLNLAGDLAQHVHRIIAGDGGAGNVVEKGELPRTALLFGEQARILHRDRDLSGGRHQHVEVALLENEFAVGMHRDHDSRRPCYPGKSARRSGIWPGAAGTWLMPRFLRVFSRSERMSSGSPLRITCSVKALRSSRVRLGSTRLSRTSSSKRISSRLLERDVEVAGVENLPQFDLDGAQNFVLIETRADRLADLGQQFVLFRAAMRIVTDYVVFERKAQLQRQSHHQPRAGRTERPALRMRKQDDAEIVFPSLQIDRGQIADVGFGENPLEFREGSDRRHRERARSCPRDRAR